MMATYKIIPGQKLQPQDLADLFKVSKFPVQNALNILAHEGFLKLIPNKGFYAKEITQEEILQLYQIREVLEVLSIKNAINKINLDNIKQLEESKLAYEKGLREPLGRNRFMYDMSFHLTISDIGKNKSLTIVLKQILEKLFFTYNIDMLSIDRGLQVCKEHRDIFKVIKRKKMDAGIKSIKQHIKMGRDYMLNGSKLRKQFLI